MRLIDADALAEKIAGIEDLRRLSTATVGGVIKDAPTVEAIPIEWLNNKIEHYAENGWHDEADDLKRLINDWERERDNE